jgi:hypothetical protein
MIDMGVSVFSPLVVILLPLYCQLTGTWFAPASPIAAQIVGLTQLILTIISFRYAIQKGMN